MRRECSVDFGTYIYIYIGGYREREEEEKSEPMRVHVYFLVTLLQMSAAEESDG